MKLLKNLTTLALTIALITSCTTSTTAPHNGLFPFSQGEKPASLKTTKKQTTHPHPKRLTPILHYTPENKKHFHSITKKIQPGDVIAFYMSHPEASKHLKQRNIQKIPYKLFRYGHLAIITPDKKLLQVAMKQAINTDSDLTYLKDKKWVIYRAPAGTINLTRLTEFTKTITTIGSSPKKAYNYTAALGLKNGNIHPTKKSEISPQYTCTTLIVAALNYSGYHLHTAKRKGYLDIITPRQVTDSWGHPTNQ